MADLPLAVDTYTRTQLNDLIERANVLYEDDTVFAYMDISGGAVDTVITTPGTWVKVKGVFTNIFGKYWEAGTNGIKRKSDAPTKKFLLRLMYGGKADNDGDIRIAMAKNGTFDGETLTSDILEGSGGKDYADTVAGSDGEINPNCSWQGELVADDEITLVMTMTDGTGTTNVTPDGASALAQVAR